MSHHMIYKVFKMIWSLIPAIALMLPLVLSAQEKSEEVTIIAPYNPSVTTASKINRNPKIRFADATEMPVIEYNIQSVRINSKLSPESPRPSQLPREPQKDLYRSHLRAGFGNYLTPYFELWVNSLQSDEFSAGAHIGHISSFGQIKDYAKSSYANTLVEAYANKYFNDNTFGAKLSYSNKMVHRYGYKPADFITPDIYTDDDDIKQTFNRVGFDLGLSSNKEDDDAFNYHVLLDGYYLFDKFESNETGLFFDGGISKKMDMFSNRRSQELGIDLGADYYMNKDSLNSYNGGIFSATPYLDMDLSPYRIFAGVKASYRMDTASKIHFYPMVKAEASLLEKMIVIYAGAEGGLDRVSYDILTTENPFVNSIMPLDFSNRYDFYGGVRGRISEIVDFNFGLKYQIINNMPFFVNDSSNFLGNTFDLVYDDAGVFRVYGELGFRSHTNFGLLLKAGYNSYSLDHELKPWHRPALDINLEAYYVIKEKLTLSANLSSMQGVYARTFVNGEVNALQLDAWYDIGLGGEYQINSQFSAFLKLNNILNNGYFKWHQYPVQKFNALAGIGFSF